MPLEHGQDHQFQFGDVDVGEVGQQCLLAMPWQD
jgi:hypothetical protein